MDDSPTLSRTSWLLARLGAFAAERERPDATARRALGRSTPALRRILWADEPFDEKVRRLREAGLGEREAWEVGMARRDALHAERVLRAQADPGALGLTAPRFEALLARSFPLPFEAEEPFVAMVRQLDEALGEAPARGSLRLIGTSATLFSLHPEKSPDRYFDSEPGGRSDVDLGLESPGLSAWLLRQGAAVEPSPINEGGTIGCAELVRLLPGLGGWLGRWSEALGRQVAVVATADGRPPRWPSVMHFVVPLPRGGPEAAGGRLRPRRSRAR